MKKRKVKTLLCAVLAASMVMGVSGCGSNDGDAGKSDEPQAENGQTQTDDGQGESGEQTQEAAELTADGYDSRYFDEEGNMKLPLTDGSYTYKVLWRKDSTDKGTIEDKYMLQEALKATGIQIEVEEVPDSGWEEKLSVIFASGDLPDLICGSTVNMINYIDQCTDITDMLPRYAPFMNKFYTEMYPASLKVNEFNGRIYSLNQVRINDMRTGALYSINTQWLENLGLEIPKTTEDLYQVLKAFKEQDANGNGDPNDEIPYSFVGVGGHSNSDNGLLMMMQLFGMVNDGASGSHDYIMVEDGTVKFAPTEQRFYDMLVYINKLYSEGLIDQDSLVQENTDRVLKGNEGIIGFFSHNGLATTVVGDEMGEQYEYILPPESEHGSYLLQKDPPAEMSTPCFIISNTCPEPELLIMLAEYMVSTPDFRFYSRFGPEGTSWIQTEDGAANNTDFTGKPYSTRNEATATVSLHWHFPVLCTSEEEARRAIVGYSIPYNDAVQNLYGPSGGHAWTEIFPMGNDTVENSSRRSELLAEIDPYIENFVAEAMTSGIDDAKWQAHLENCKKLNVEEYVQCYQELLERIGN